MAATESGAPATGRARRKRWWRRIRWVVRIATVLFVIGYLKFVGLDGKFYYPDRKPYDRPEDYDLAYQDVSFPTADGLKLHGWFLPAEGKPRGAVLHLHGNAANVSAHVGLIDWLPRAGYHVLMFDYRGYGRSEGKVTRAGTIRDGHAALDYLLSRPETQGLPVFAYGQSLGGPVAIVVAAARPEIRAVVAESPFSSYRGIAARHIVRLVRAEWLAKLLAAVTISDGYDPIAVVSRLAPRPLLVIAAENDQICFPEQARELYAAAAEPKSYWLVPGAEHLAVSIDARDELTERVSTLFAQAAHP